MFHMARQYGVTVHGITICQNQADYIRRYAAEHNLPVTVEVMNYLELDESRKWHRIVSIGMMCHIGQANIDKFFDKVAALSAPGAIVLLHCISKMQESPGGDPFVLKHVFPGYWFNSMEGLASRSVERGFNVLDVENLRRHYALTLRHWRKNFLRNYAAIQAKMGFDDRFMRGWEYYLAQTAAGFSIGKLNLLQYTMSMGVNDEYPWTREFLYEGLDTPAPAADAPKPEPAAPPLHVVNRN